MFPPPFPLNSPLQEITYLDIYIILYMNIPNGNSDSQCFLITYHLIINIIILY